MVIDLPFFGVVSKQFFALNLMIAATHRCFIRSGFRLCGIAPVHGPRRDVAERTSGSESDAANDRAAQAEP
jgi:hypothetical protein